MVSLEFVFLSSIHVGASQLSIPLKGLDQAARVAKALLEEHVNVMAVIVITMTATGKSCIYNTL